MKSVMLPRLSSHNRLAWALRAKAMERTNWQSILEQDWPFDPNFDALDFAGKWRLYDEVYGSYSGFFFNRPRVRHENDTLNEAYGVIMGYADQVFLENQLTGKCKPPDTRGIPWGIKEVLKIMRMVDDWHKYQIPELPEPTSKNYGEAVNNRTKAEKNKARMWQDTIEYASGLDVFTAGLG